MKITRNIVEITVGSSEENQQLQSLLEEHGIPQIWWPSRSCWSYPVTYTLQEDEFKKIEEAKILQH